MSTQHPAVAALEKALDDAGRHDGPFRPGGLAELDEREAFPTAAIRALDDLGLARHYVPTRYGGLLDDHGELLLLLRAVARRDLTVAVAHAKTFLGGACAWVAGTTAQATALGAEIQRGAVAAWGLTERHHGSDLLAGELSATPTGAGWLLDGEKWLINNATRGDLITVLARTDPAGGPRGFSLFLVDKRTLPDGSYRHRPKILTHGIRGADISGIAFHHAPVPETALVGDVGDGIETVLKALQLTRTVAVGLSLGAADHALSLATGFAEGRNLYGRRLTDLPRVRRILGEISATVFLAEATALVSARTPHALTGELSVASAVTKAAVPTLAQDAIDRLTELMGTRGFLSRTYAEGQYAKLERDHRIVAIFDGSTAVNRNALIDQFARLARAYRDGRWNETGLAEAAGLDRDLTPFDPARQRLLSGDGCSLVQSLPDAAQRIAALADRGLLPLQTARLADELTAVADRLHEDMAALRRTPRDVPPTAFHLAERYELLYAGAAALRLWLHNAPTADPAAGPQLWRNGLWLAAALAAVLTRLGHPVDESHAAAYDRVADLLLAAPTGTFSLLTTDDLAWSTS
ncbi:acyl-CoA dehydrogenase family protein [Streptomyces varsoviensis]|uniref:acyl-CoA dehydrogenase family protein n=1 Tax=Streptomyces varsoviensis TaxID=67373 RepID=UPI0004C5336A|nr:acyl-CoA dehydrogenase family protein [Streptomyces varsoviensis]